MMPRMERFLSKKYMMKPEKFAELMERMHGIPVSVSMQRLRKSTENDPSFGMRSKQIGGSGSAASSFGMRVKLNPTTKDVEQKTSDASSNIRKEPQKMNMDASIATRKNQKNKGELEYRRENDRNRGQQGQHQEVGGHVQSMYSDIDMDTNPAHTKTDQELESAARISGRITDQGHVNYGWHQRNKNSAESVLDWRKRNGIKVVRGVGDYNTVTGPNADYYRETYHSTPVDYTGILQSPSDQIQRVPRAYDVSENITSDSYSRKPIAN